jgi:excisionase family DNA binding protein
MANKETPRRPRPSEETYFDRDEIAAKLHVPPPTVEYWWRVGKLESVKPGRKRLSSATALDAFIVGAK